MTLRALILIVYFSFVNLSLVIAQSETDSLISLIEVQNNDTNKINTMVELATRYLASDLEMAELYAQKVLKLSIEMDFLPGIADYYYLTSAGFVLKGNIDSAHYYDDKLFAILEKFHDLNRKAKYYRAHAILLQSSGNHSSAIDFYKQSLDLYTKTGNKQKMAVVYNSMGTMLIKSAEYDSAVKLFLTALRIYEEENIQYRRQSVYINLGKVYFYLKDYNKAMDHYKKALDFSLKNDILVSVALCYMDMGMAYYRMDSLDKAEEYLELSKQKYTELDHKSGIANSILNLGVILEDEGKYTQAMDEFKKARGIYIETHRIVNEESALSNIALMHERLGDYELALKTYDTCLQMAYQNNLRERILHNYHNIYKVYELMGNFTKAYQYSIRYIHLKDSIFNLEKEETINSLELKYEKEKNLAHILRLQNDNLQQSMDLRKRTNQRNVFFILSSSIILIAFILFIFLRSKARKDKIIADQKIAELEKEKKLLAAKALVEGQEVERRRIASDLHDGIGALLTTVKMQFSNIRKNQQINETEIEKAEELLNQASGDVRKISHNMMPSVLTKLGLEEALEDLFDKVNISKDLSASITLLNDDSIHLPENSEIMIYRIVQELVNNTIKHAKASVISLNVVFNHDKITLQYSDNGIGFNYDERLLDGAVGLSSLQTRIEFLGAELNIDTAPNKGFLCYIQLPMG